jgi:hypothetical protein
MPVVDLARWQDDEVRVFAGRDRGREVRRAANLDVLDQDPERVEVRIPTNTFAVNSSFFLAMFGKSIRDLKEAGFRSKYFFTGKDIRDTIESCIKDALHVGNLL